MIQPPFTDNSLMPFGKYKGKAMINIPAHYLIWLYNNGVMHQGVKQYIISNLSVLQKEVERSRR